MKSEVGVCIWALALLQMAVGAPVISDVSVVQARNRKVTVSYVLSGDPAIVTLDLLGG